MIRCYTDLMLIADFLGRFDYLKLKGEVGEATFGSFRFMNQDFYRSKEWRDVRNEVIVRDYGLDLGIEGRAIPRGLLLIHHMNPISMEDLEHGSRTILDPEYLITVSERTHEAIHYGDSSLLFPDPVERSPNDTCLWRGCHE